MVIHWVPQDIDQCAPEVAIKSRPRKVNYLLLLPALQVDGESRRYRSTQLYTNWPSMRSASTSLP